MSVINCYHLDASERAMKAMILAALLAATACTSAPRSEYRLAWPDGKAVKLNETRR